MQRAAVRRGSAAWNMGAGGGWPDWGEPGLDAPVLVGDPLVDRLEEEAEARELRVAAEAAALLEKLALSAHLLQDVW